MPSALHGPACLYEVCEVPQGFLVRPRELATGRVLEDATTLFRSAAVAHRFARLAAALDHAAHDLPPDPCPESSVVLADAEPIAADPCGAGGSRRVQADAVDPITGRR